MRKTVLTSAFAVAVFVAIGAATPASAKTSFSVFFGSGYGYEPYWGVQARSYPRYYSPRPGRFPHWRRHAHDFPPYYPPRTYYVPAPVVVTPPPVVYSAPPVVVAPPPVVTALPADQRSPTYTDNYGRTCREYQAKSSIGGAVRDVYGTACLQPDGSWRVVD